MGMLSCYAKDDCPRLRAGKQTAGGNPMDRVDAGPAVAATCDGEGRIGAAGERPPGAWSSVLTVATATAVLLSGLNGFVQIIKVALECAYAHR